MPNAVEVPLEFHRAGRVLLRDDRLSAVEAKLAGLPAAPPNRLVYAAAHVVMKDRYRDVDHSVDHPGTAAEIEVCVDWEATMGLRRELDDLGFGIAEAMDTAQRFSLGWTGAHRLITECGGLGLENGFVAGASTDHLESVSDKSALIDGVVYQAGLIRAAGGEVILLPMPQLTAWHANAADYVAVYRAIIEQVDGPVFVHWLGEMFLPNLAGYFPADSFEQVMALDPSKVRGAKLSLLDAAREIELRAVLRTNDQIMLTGDDFHFASLIGGTNEVTGATHVGDRTVATGEFSHALLGIFDGIGRPAALGLQFLARGDIAAFHEVMGPCEDLSRLVFCEPTTYYKSGLAFLSWLNGQQSNPMLVNHEEAKRDPRHYVAVAELASKAGVLCDAGLAASRLRQFLKEHS